MKERSLQDWEWLTQKKENEQRNKLLFEGWKEGKFYCQTLMTKILFRKILEQDQEYERE